MKSVSRSVEEMQRWTRDPRREDGEVAGGRADALEGRDWSVVQEDDMKDVRAFKRNQPPGETAADDSLREIDGELKVVQ